MNNKGQLGIFNAFWLAPVMLVMYYCFLLIFNPLLGIIDFSNTPNGSLVQLVFYSWPIIVALVWGYMLVQKMREQ
jgi:hypothetical protein